MGLPELSFSYGVAAKAASARVKQGIVALILEDDGMDPGVYTVVHEADIPTELGTDNQDYIKRALIGHINAPSKVLVAVQASESEPVDGLKLLTGMDYDYVAGPPDLDSEKAEAMANTIKEMREKNYIGKAVLPNVEGDHEAIVNFATSGIVVGKTTYTAAQYCSRIAGMLAGTPQEGSATGAALDEVSNVEAKTDQELGEAIDAGKLVLRHDGRKVRVARAVTSKTTISDSESEDLKKIKVVEVIDLIHYYAVAVAEDEFLGQCANTYDNRVLLTATLGQFLKDLETQDLIDAGSSSADIDAEAARAWMVEQGISVTEMDDDAIRKYNTGSYVFVTLSGKVLDAMEDFRIHFVLQR